MLWPGRRPPGDLDRPQRTARLVDAGWVLPWGLGRQVDQSGVAFVPRLAGEGLVNRTGRRWTLVGPSGGPAAAVDPAGLVTPRLGGWSLDWWVGADDRWRLPSREPAVRQSLVDSTPVVETVLRVPSGDAVHRCFGVPGFLVIEVENRSPSPFALALVIRPYDPLGATSVATVAVEGSQVLVDGRTALILSGPSRRMAASTAASGDVAGLVLSGAAGPRTAPAVCHEGLASVAVLVPVAHRTTVRAVIPLGGPSGGVDGRASSTAAVRGWKAQSPGRDGVRIDVPDGQLQHAFDAACRSLLLIGPEDAATPEEAELIRAALAATGRSTMTSDARSSAPARSSENSFVPPARGAEGPSGPAERGSAGPSGPAERGSAGPSGPAGRGAEGPGLPPPTTAAASAIGDRPGRVATPHAAARGPAGYDVVATMAAAAAEVASGDPAALGRLAWLVGVGAPTWAWPDHVHPRTGAGSDGRGHSPAATAAFLLLVRDLLVTEPEPGHAVLLPVLPDEWRGQPVRVDDAVLSGGVRLSYAVRWHGERPALLWEANSGLRLTAPGLDARFLTDEPRGEALLSPPAPPAGSGGGGTVELS